jgi:hypothetical protein
MITLPTFMDNKNAIRQALLPHRLEVINQHASWIRRHEPYALDYVIDGNLINPMQIAPYLQECHTDQEHSIWRYLRYYSVMPYSEYVGRRQRFLIRDAGHPDHPIMGITAIGSSVMHLNVRDRWIGWYIDTNLSEEERMQYQCGELSFEECRVRLRTRRERSRNLRGIKMQRIAAIADLYVSQAIPPYNELTAGKLLCLMMLSNEVRDLFHCKYVGRQTEITKREAADLVLLVTTTIFGLRSSLYNRLRFLGQTVYIPVGETSGFGTFQVSEADFLKMRHYLATLDKEPSNAFGKGSNWRMRVIRTYYDLRHKKEPGYENTGNSKLQHGQHRGVFVAPLAYNARAYLTGEDDIINPYDWPIEELVEWWKERWLKARANNPEVMARVRAFRKETLRISELIIGEI